MFLFEKNRLLGKLYLLGSHVLKIIHEHPFGAAFLLEEQLYEAESNCINVYWWQAKEYSGTSDLPPWKQELEQRRKTIVGTCPRGMYHVLSY